MNLSLISKINELKKENNAIILVHNYQRPEIYKVADFIGDSLELSREAECPMAGMVSKKDLLNLKKEYPNAGVVSYINTRAETKAESDICCTSANAVDVVNSLSKEQIIFVPDENLAKYVQSKTNKMIIPWKGFCYVHAKITPNQVKEAKKFHPDAKVLVHPECTMEVIKLADYVCSTSQMITSAKKDSSDEFIIVTEQGMVERLKLEIPDKKFYMIVATCIQQKKNTLKKVLISLQDEIHPINLDEEIMKKAKLALQKMLDISKKSD